MSSSRRRRLALAAAAVLLLPAAASAQTTVYSNDFESGPLGPEWSGAGALETTGGLSAFGFGATHLRNAGSSATLLRLFSLAPHTSVTLTFDLAMWDSIDFGDTFQVFGDATTLFNGPFGNYGTPSGDCEGPGVRISAPFTSFSDPNYGVNSGFHDCARSVSFTFAHAQNDVTLAFAYPNTQGGTDESFGVDNVVVRTDAEPLVSSTPEPGTWALMATGLAALAVAQRRRRRV